MKQFAFSVVALALFGPCLSASAQTGHAHPDGGTPLHTAGASASYPTGQLSTTPDCTARFSQMENSDNEGQSNPDGNGNDVDSCFSTPDQLSGDFDYTTQLKFINNIQYVTNVNYSAYLTVSGFVDYNKGNANSTSQLGGSGPSDSCSEPTGPGTYGSGPHDTQTVNGFQQVAAYNYATISGVANGTSSCFN